MFDISKLPKRMNNKVLAHYAANEFRKIGKIFLEHGVTHCDTCASNLTAIREWMTYWVSQGIITKNE